jgi:hypothetical protein
MGHGLALTSSNRRETSPKLAGTTEKIAKLSRKSATATEKAKNRGACSDCGHFRCAIAVPHPLGAVI